MRKLRLDLEELAVDSFDTQPCSPPAGTVKGRTADTGELEPPRRGGPLAHPHLPHLPAGDLLRIYVATCETCQGAPARRGAPARVPLRPGAPHVRLVRVHALSGHQPRRSAA